MLCIGIMSNSTPTDTPPVRDRGADRPLRYDDARGTYHTRCDETAYEPVSSALVTAVSSIRHAAPTDLDPLHEAVDPDALNALFVHWHDRSTGDADGSIRFTYSNCDVTVSSDGEIVVDPR